MLLFALLLLILIVEDRDNERYPDPRYTPAADGAAEPAGGSSEASVSAPQDDGKETEDSNAIQAHDGRSTGISKGMGCASLFEVVLQYFVGS